MGEFGEFEYFLYYPSFATPLFKYIGTFAACLFIGALIYTGSWMLLIDPTLMVLGSARMLSGWKNEVKKVRSLACNEYNFVTVDRKRFMLIVHRINKTIGFEARFNELQALDEIFANSENPNSCYGNIF